MQQTERNIKTSKSIHSMFSHILAILFMSSLATTGLQLHAQQTVAVVYNDAIQEQQLSNTLTNWQPTGNYRCLKDENNNNTGYREREEKDLDSCSVTYNQLRWVGIGLNCASCAKSSNWLPTGNYRCVKDGGNNNTGYQEQEEKDNETCSATYNQLRWTNIGLNCTTCPRPASWQPTGNLRCVLNGGNNTGEQEREERDTVTCSSTYNQLRWVSVGSNCTTCPASANWQPTGNYRCVQSGGINTGEREREEIDNGSCSATYNQLRWVSVGTNCTACPKPANWQPTGNYRCAKDGSNNNTGYREREEIDQESCSTTYNQLRWVSVGTNCSICPKPANWQPTGNYRCVQSGGINTGEREREEIDQESCSATYNQLRWVSVGTNCTVCPKPANWQPTGNYRCVTSGGNNTGEREREEIDQESCSTTYNQLRWVSVGTNCSICPKPANWQPTGNYRCVQSGGINTGEREREEIDQESCSATYNQLRWVSVGTNCTTCPKPANWQPTGNYRCVQSGGNNTGEREKEEKDLETCSATYNQLRWVSVGTNCSVCPKPANWQPTGNYRCVQSGGINTGEREREEIDQESCSATYNQLRWVSVGTNCSVCPKPANWQATGNYRCVLDAYENNTGEREKEEKDLETCSATYNQLRWVSVGTNCTACPKPANWQSTGNYRCVKDPYNNTGYQEREERDNETCSATYNQLRWVSNGYNTTACPLPTMVTLYYDNSTFYTINIHMTNTSTGQQYYFTINGAGSGVLGSVVEGTYDIEMWEGNYTNYLNYEAGCGYFAYGGLVTFYNVPIHFPCDTFYIY